MQRAPKLCGTFMLKTTFNDRCLHDSVQSVVVCSVQLTHACGTAASCAIALFHFQALIQARLQPSKPPAWCNNPMFPYVLGNVAAITAETSTITAAMTATGPGQGGATANAAGDASAASAGAAAGVEAQAAAAAAVPDAAPGATAAEAAAGAKAAAAAARPDPGHARLGPDPPAALGPVRALRLHLMPSARRRAGSAWVMRRQQLSVSALRCSVCAGVLEMSGKCLQDHAW